MLLFVAALAAFAAASPETQLPLLGQDIASGFSNDTETNHIYDGDDSRFYAINIPENYNASKQYPLIFDYHGRSGTPYQQYLNSMYFAYPAGQEYIVVYPQGLAGDDDKSAWQGAPYAAEDVDDLQFTSDLLDHIKETYGIDLNRVYASGKSNGGGFVDTLACSDVGDKFAAFAMAAAALYTDNSRSSCNKKRAILEAHGDSDCTIPYTGKANAHDGGRLPVVNHWFDWWGLRDDCHLADKVDSEDQGGYRIHSFSCGGVENVTQHYDIFGLGHCWPSSSGNNFDAQKGPRKCTNGQVESCADRSLDWTPVVLEWFGRWNLSSADDLSAGKKVEL